MALLVIEDNQDYADILCSMFSILGHEAYAAYDGIAGIARGWELQPEVIFCDIRHARKKRL